MTSFRTSIKLEIQIVIRYHISGGSDTADCYYAAADAAKEKVMSMVVDTTKPPIEATKGNFVNVFGPWNQSHFMTLY
jgi:hypothetical protein